MKKLFSVILAFLLLMGSLVSCGTGTEDTNTTAGDHTTNAEDETRETLDIPDTRYDGEELCFLTRDHGEWTTLEIFSENQTAESDNISTAVFERNDRILQTYGVTITEIKKDGKVLFREEPVVQSEDAPDWEQWSVADIVAESYRLYKI